MTEQQAKETKRIGTQLSRQLRETRMTMEELAQAKEQLAELRQAVAEGRGSVVKGTALRRK